MGINTNAVQRLYLAYFNRPGDPVGMAHWEAQLPATAATQAQLAAIAAGFSGSAEYIALYAGQSNTSIVNNLYLNLFGRAAEPAGLLSWAGRLTAGTETFASIALQLTYSAQGTDATAIANKLTAANSFTTALDTAAEIVGYSGTAAATSGRTYLAAVTDVTATLTTSASGLTASVAAAVAAGASSGGTTFTLTASADSGTAFTGTSSNDTFNGAYNSDPAATFSVGDILDGGAGNDTILITKTAAIAQTDVAPVGATVTNVEIATLTSGAQVVANTSTGALTGITTLNTTGAGGATVTAATTTDINLTDTATDSQTNDEVAVNGGKNVSITLTAASELTDNAGTEISVGATTAAAGTVAVTHTGKYADSTSATLTTIGVTGGTTIAVTQNSGITAAQATAALTDATNDTVTMGAITVTGNASTTAVTITQSAAQTETDAADGSGRIGIVNGASTINDVNAASGTAAGTITTATFANFAAATVDSSALTTLNLSGEGTTVDYSRGALTATPTANTLTMNITGLTTTGAVTDAEAAADDGFTTINIANTTTASTIASFVAADATTLTVSGNAKLTLTAHTAALLATITSTNTGGLDMDGTALSNTAVFTGGTGADAIQLGATTKAHTMGAGNDIVVYAAAAGTGGSVAGGDGTDMLVMSFTLADAADADATFNSSYTGFEKLQVTAAFTGALDIDGLNNVSTVQIDGDASGGAVNNIDSGGTVHTKADSTGGWAITIGGAVASLTDVLNLKLDKTGVLAVNTLTVANVETINIDGTDTATTGGTAAINTIALAADRATSVVVTGNNGLNVTSAAGSTRITNFDASAVIGNSTTAVAGTAATTDTAANLAVLYTSVNATANAAVTIKGGAGDDTLTGSAAAVNVDTITGGAGDDIIRGGAGADVLDGGANSSTGADTVTYADVTAATSHSLTNISGMAINMGTAAVTAATIATAMGGTVVLGGGAGVAGSELAAGSAGYLATTAANSLALMVRDTVTGFETVIGSTLADYIYAGEGKNTITAGAGADYVDLTETTAAIDTVVLTGSASHVSTTDIDNKINGFGSADIIDFTTNTAFRHAGAAITGYTEGAKASATFVTAAGFVALSNNITVASIAVGPTEAEMETYFGAVETFFNGGANDAVYVAVDDGVNTYILELQSGGTGKLFTEADDAGVVVATLVGVTDATSLSAANTADFT